MSEIDSVMGGLTPAVFLDRCLHLHSYIALNKWAKERGYIKRYRRKLDWDSMTDTSIRSKSMDLVSDVFAPLETALVEAGGSLLIISRYSEIRINFPLLSETSRIAASEAALDLMPRTIRVGIRGTFGGTARATFDLNYSTLLGRCDRVLDGAKYSVIELFEHIERLLIAGGVITPPVVETVQRAEEIAAAVDVDSIVDFIPAAEPAEVLSSALAQAAPVASVVPVVPVVTVSPAAIGAVSRTTYREARPLYHDNAN